METQAKATKCVTVKTPFGFMYMELTGSTYLLGTDVVTTKSALAYKEARGFFTVTPVNSEWVRFSNGGDGLIVSNCGDKFPGQRK